jgi:molybdopterin converting factor subunit 1
MKVSVQLFGPLAEQAGVSRLEVVVSGSTVRDVLAAVAVAAPALKLDRSVRFAVNTDYADASAAVREGDTVSLIPPVGGG